MLAGSRNQYLPHAKRALYQMSYKPRSGGACLVILPRVGLYIYWVEACLKTSGSWCQSLAPWCLQDHTCSLAWGRKLT